MSRRCHGGGSSSRSDYMGGGSHCLPGMARKLLGTVPRSNGATSRFLNVKHPRGEVYLFPFEDRFMGNWDLAKEEVSCRTKNDLLLHEAKCNCSRFFIKSWRFYTVSRWQSCAHSDKLAEPIKHIHHLCHCRS